MRCEQNGGGVKGTYLLILKLDTLLPDLPIGRLGRFAFPAGYYLYVGSAHGAGGLSARLARHLRREKPRPRWHIDYLRACAEIVEIWSVSSPARLETHWALALERMPEVSIPVPRFGASDTHNRSHLFYLPGRPPLRLLTAALLAGIAGQSATPIEFVLEISRIEDDPRGSDDPTARDVSAAGAGHRRSAGDAALRGAGAAAG